MSETSVLKIDKSVMQSRWVFPAVNDDQVHRLMQDHQLNEIVARLLVSRNVDNADVDTYLNPKLSRDFPDPFSMMGMKDFADYLSDAIIAGKKIAAFCDFDVDGSTSAAVLKRFFRHLGQDIPIYIPDRMVEGYGPNAKSLHTLKQDGADIVLMADCGTTAFDVIAQGRELGLEICVFDHHEAEDLLPVANHVINPKRKDDTSGLGMLAAVGVTFLCCVAVNTTLRARKYYEIKGIAEPSLKSWLDLVGLGTVCDMVPLTGANRLFVKEGFRQMAKGENVGLAALAAVANMKKPPTSDDAGFVLGPRINAGSRVHQSDLGAKLLSCEDAEEAKNLAWTLNDCNDKRRLIQADMLRDAVSRVEMGRLYDHPIIFVHDESWHVGLNGLVAGQLKEKYGKPACVIAFAPGMDGQLEGRGSGRSVAGFNLAALFMRAREAGLLIKGGGHAMAAGFTVTQDKIEQLHSFLRDEAARAIEQGIELISEDPVDGVATIRGMKPDFVRLLETNVGPFGMANPEPRFVLPFVKIVSADIVGESHVRLMLADIEGGARMKAIAFRAVDTPLGEALLGNKGRQAIHLMGQFHVNSWNGSESVEFHVEDAAYPSGIAQQSAAAVG
jgi:single-stranded-DNA-specific exonuclease